jgi:23S rRNA pseudouridine2605 synthase
VSVRLNKLLAQRGIGARRKCDALIQSGAVRVNGAVVREPGVAVEPDRDRVEVNGRPLPPREPTAYYVLHKPVGVISTLSDPEGRRTLVDFLPPGRRLFPVGRLDADTSGLLILTSDGELAHHLMHPRYGVTKLYRVHTDRAPSPEMLRRLREGIEFEPGVVSAPARVRVRDTGPGESVIELELHEGRYRQVRRMCEAAGLRVLRLHRWGYGPLRLAGLERGLWRELSEEEVQRLRSASARAHPRPAGAGPMRRPARPRGDGARRDGAQRRYGSAAAEVEREPRRFRGRPDRDASRRRSGASDDVAAPRRFLPEAGGTSRPRGGRPADSGPGSRTGSRPRERSRERAKTGPASNGRSGRPGRPRGLPTGPSGRAGGARSGRSGRPRGLPTGPSGRAGGARRGRRGRARPF